MNIYLTFSLWDLRFTHSAFNGNSPAVTTKRRTSISSISYSSRGAGTLCRAIYGQHSSWYQTAWELFSHFPGEQTCCMPIRSRRKSENKGKNKKPKLIFQINTRDNFFSESFAFIWCFCPKWLKVIHIHWWQLQPSKMPTSTSGAVWGSVSCPRALSHADLGNWTKDLK